MSSGTRTSLAGRLMLFALLLCGAAALLALAAAPAHAFPEWAHGGLPETECSSCHAPTGGIVPDACTFCHTGYKTTAGQQCWDCHEPGAPTSGLSSPSSACSQGCHLYSDFYKDYVTPFTHGTEPHDGASGYGKTCLDCHQTSIAWNNPGESPHHDGVEQSSPTCTQCHDGVTATAEVSHDGVGCEDCHDGMNIPPRPAACTTCHIAATFGGADCTSCHASQVHNTTPAVPSCTGCHTGYQKHAGQLTCTKCHTNAASFHHGTQQPKVKGCRSCHAMKHAGQKVAASKCAGCHKGSYPAPKPAAQHSSSITKKYTCSLCHSKGLHAKAYGAKTTCRTCHTGKFHASQAKPGNSVCTKCHGTASRHANGYRCTLCHKSAVHDTTPHA